MLKGILHELKRHIPFTAFGALSGIAIAAVFIFVPNIPQKLSGQIFEICHPLHVLVSAMATAAMLRLHGRKSLFVVVLVGYIGSVGIGTLSDCLIPYLGERLLGLEHAHAHIGFIEHWYIVNPLALLGIAIAYFWPRTKFPHAGHVLLSTWASLFHILMAVGAGHDIGVGVMAAIGAILFFAVWVPCCTSDIVFPLLFAAKNSGDN